MVKSKNLQGFKFRHWKFGDIPEIIRVNRRCLPENYSRRTFLGLWNKYKDLLFLCFDEEQASSVAYIIVKMDKGSSFFEEKEVLKGHIFSLAVLPKYRRRGIASVLLSLSLRRMEGKNGKEIFLEVRKSNTPAISLYEKFNFSIVGTVPGYYADGETSMIMAVRTKNCKETREKTIEKARNDYSASIPHV